MYGPDTPTCCNNSCRSVTALGTEWSDDPAPERPKPAREYAIDRRELRHGVPHREPNVERIGEAGLEHDGRTSVAALYDVERMIADGDALCASARAASRGSAARIAVAHTDRAITDVAIRRAAFTRHTSM